MGSTLAPYIIMPRDQNNTRRDGAASLASNLKEEREVVHNTHTIRKTRRQLPKLALMSPDTWSGWHLPSLPLLSRLWHGDHAHSCVLV